MNSIMTFLTFTLEIGEDFGDKKLPTLDVTIWVEQNRILYNFFEKPMSTNLVLHAKTAKSNIVKFSSLTQEVVRRLLHTSRELSHSCRLENLERFSVKMMTSEHKSEFVKKVLFSGMIKYERKVKKSQLPIIHKDFKPLHVGTNYNRLG